MDFFDDIDQIKKQLISMKENIEQANKHDEELANVQRFNSSTEQALQDLHGQLGELHQYVDELKAQRDQAINQNKELMALITRTKAVENHPGFAQSQNASHTDTELDDLKKVVADMQKKMKGEQ